MPMDVSTLMMEKNALCAEFQPQIFSKVGPKTGVNGVKWKAREGNQNLLDSQHDQRHVDPVPPRFAP